MIYRWVCDGSRATIGDTSRFLDFLHFCQGFSWFWRDFVDFEEISFILQGFTRYLKALPLLVPPVALPGAANLLESPDGPCRGLAKRRADEVIFANLEPRGDFSWIFHGFSWFWLLFLDFHIFAALAPGSCTFSCFWWFSEIFLIFSSFWLLVTHILEVILCVFRLFVFCRFCWFLLIFGAFPVPGIFAGPFEAFPSPFPSAFWVIFWLPYTYGSSFLVYCYLFLCFLRRFWPPEHLFEPFAAVNS